MGHSCHALLSTWRRHDRHGSNYIIFIFIFIYIYRGFTSHGSRFLCYNIIHILYFWPFVSRLPHTGPAPFLVEIQNNSTFSSPLPRETTIAVALNSDRGWPAVSLASPLLWQVGDGLLTALLHHTPGTLKKTQVKLADSFWSLSKEAHWFT